MRFRLDDHGRNVVEQTAEKVGSVLLNQSDDAYVAELRASTRSVLKAAIGDAKDVAILDAPNQTNVGDSLIWAGELEHLRSMGLRLRYVADIKSFDAAEVRRIMPNGVVLLHGGGNFGDIWIGHQNHREQIVRELHDYRIVQLSQSVFFSSKDRAAQADRVLREHPDFHLLLRDPLSIARAKEMLPSLEPVFCYDMALGYEPPARLRLTPDDRSVLVIAREDKEAMSGLSGIGDDWLQSATVVKTDWHSTGWLGVRYRSARSMMRLQTFLQRVRRKVGIFPTLPQTVVRALIVSINAINIEGALRLYKNAGIVVVDRLHAHVLALLLGIPHVALDNNYRKIGAVFDLYTGRFTTARYATDVTQARAFVEELIAD